jgi:D-alanyl-lipoteichoic acid acyltransferase DltB (MBOAT superfamily)
MILLGQLATMLLIGLWHGVTVNFVLWGAWHGLGLFAHNRWSDLLRGRPLALLQDDRWQRVFGIASMLATFHFVAFGWVFFALSTPAASLEVFMKLVGLK